MSGENLRSNVLTEAGLITGVSLVLGLLFNYFFFEKVPGLSFPLYTVLIVIGLLTISAFFKKRMNKEVIWLFVPLIFFSAMVFVRASILLTFLNIAASLFLLLIIANIFSEGRLRSYLASDYIKTLFTPLKFFGPLFQTLTDLFFFKTNDANKKTLSQVVRGTLISIPFLIIFALLFSSADLIFQKYLSSIINFDIEEETIVRLLLILAITLGFTGAYSYIMRNSEKKPETDMGNGEYNLGFIENYILLGSVNLLFFIFIAVQLTYLFGGDNNISSQGFTYAEYARRGFFELIAVGIFSLLLVFASEKYIVKKDGKHSTGFKLLSTILILQVLLIMVSAYLRLGLYEAAYGFTVLRLYSHVSIIFLGIIFLLLSLKIFRNQRESSFVLRAFGTAILFLVFMNLFNPDAFIARRNIENFARTGKLDTNYLNLLSEDTLRGFIKALDIPNEDIKKSIARDLYWRGQELKSSYFSGWQSLNLSRMRAEKILDTRISEFELYKDYKSQGL